MRTFPQPILVTRPLLPPIPAITRRMEDIWGAQWLTNMGKQHGILEAALTQHLRVPHLSLLCNGTIALLVAGKVLDMQGEVITTPFTFAATPHAVNWTGAEPVFADIDPVTLTLDPKAVEAAITPRTTTILAVHVFGMPCDVHALAHLAAKHNLRLLYDGAHAFGLEVEHTGIGNFGDITAYSFHATKLFHTAEGGALACGSAEMHTRIERCKNFNILSEETVGGVGINGKLNELQAAVGLAVLEIMDDERERRARIAAIYREVLGQVPGVTVQPVLPQVTRESLQYFSIRIHEQEYGLSRNALHAELKKHNVLTRKYFYPLCSTFECYKKLPSSRPENLPVATRVAAECMALPFYGALPDEDATTIASMIRDMPR
ncbi:DegT/DnrJ/EryC1/StrS family aminotransferase [Solidesulfovibrio aerotolerans]|uniref:DegT/DnrJ/EryC1/StrS family aminotransferase n=1 Tax=Solidesulfovibrio aerotolerans TaxID=295255 RepID=UPI001BA47CCE